MNTQIDNIIKAALSKKRRALKRIDRESRPKIKIAEEILCEVISNLATEKNNNANIAYHYDVVEGSHSYLELALDDKKKEEFKKLTFDQQVEASERYINTCYYEYEALKEKLVKVFMKRIQFKDFFSFKK